MLTLNSPAFPQGQPIPERFTREGDNVSPPIEWRGGPQNTASYALVVEDPDAPKGTFRHWAVYDIPGRETGLAEGAGTDTPAVEAHQAVNDFGKRGYDGPQPPPGHGTHHYHFRLFAVDVPQLRVPRNASAEDVLEAARSHAVAQADYVGTCER